MSDIKRRVRENIRRLRKEAGFSQQQLADLTGKSLRYINYLENNDSNVTIEVLDELSQAMGISITRLLATDDEPETQDLREGLLYMKAWISEKLVQLKVGEPTQPASRSIGKTMPAKQKRRKKTPS